MATIQASDVLPVRSRVSWGAVMAGVFVALSLYIVLMMGGVALGMTVGDRVRAENLGIGAGVWALVSMLLSLFLGGVVASRISVGENKTEAAIYGVVVWGVFFALLALLTAGTVNTGLNALLGAANVAQAAGANRLSEEDLRRAGFTQEQMDQFKGQFEKLRGGVGNTTSEDVSNAAQRAGERTTQAAWWAFAGMVLSLAAAVGGSLLGAGPSLVITSLRIRAGAVPGVADHAAGTGGVPVGR